MPRMNLFYAVSETVTSGLFSSWRVFRTKVLGGGVKALRGSEHVEIMECSSFGDSWLLLCLQRGVNLAQVLFCQTAFRCLEHFQEVINFLVLIREADIAFRAVTRR